MKQIYILALISISLNIKAQVFINEVSLKFNSTTEQYIELRGTANNNLPNNTYFVVLEAFANNAGRTKYVFDLNGLSFGSNGFLLLLQDSNPFSGHIDAGSTIATPTSGVGWGDLGSGASDFISLGTQSLLLIQSATAPVLGNDYDANNDGFLDGDASGWTILDGFGFSSGFTEFGDKNSIYGKSYLIIGALGNTNYDASSGTVIPVSPTSNLQAVQYAARQGNSTGEGADDWMFSTNLFGTIPNMALGDDFVEPEAYQSVTINTLGSENIDDDTLSTIDYSLQNIEIAPNPFADQIKLKFDASVNEASINLYDIKGRTILSDVKFANQESMTLNTEVIGSGIYLLEILIDDFKKVVKLIKG